MQWVLVYTDSAEGRLEHRTRTFANAMILVARWIRPHEQAGTIHIDMVNNGMRIICRVDGLTTAVINLYQEE